ncbi:MAG: hypothetical protein Q8R13_05620 [bacterium]|nr:hypothetical protein [bacterium]MDZ4296472.1 hypothetical protein [Patescibacteria group bacterium]
MKKTFNKMAMGAAGLLLASELLVPAVSLAQSPSPSASPRAEVNFCTQTTQFSSRITGRFDTRLSVVDIRRTERQNRLVSRKSQRDQVIDVRRDNGDTQRTVRYESLAARATTDAEKQAVAAFKTAMEAAVSARRTAVDKARITFRQQLDQEIAKRNTSMDSARNSYKSAVDSALAKAKTDCAAGIAPVTARQTTQTSMPAARDKFRSDIAAIERASYQSLTTTRNQAVQRAVDDFRTAAQKAADDLRAAFGQS